MTIEADKKAKAWAKQRLLIKELKAALKAAKLRIVQLETLLKEKA